nr:retrovirus-related Pol polyprotein from transposon TNT 1-94 [Tanacetum cinerariifolium]
MLIAAPNKDQIRELKDQLSNEFDMKDLGAAKRILGMEIQRDRKIGYVDFDYAGDLDARKSFSSYIFSHCGSAIGWSDEQEKEREKEIFDFEIIT